MGFDCGICANHVEGERATRLVVATREKIYPVRLGAHTIAGGFKRDDPGGVGIEIEREVLACERCATMDSRLHCNEQQWDLRVERIDARMVQEVSKYFGGAQ